MWLVIVMETLKTVLVNVVVLQLRIAPVNVAAMKKIGTIRYVVRRLLALGRRVSLAR